MYSDTGAALMEGSMNSFIALIVVLSGVLVITFNRQLTANYSRGYDHTAKWLLGPLSPRALRLTHLGYVLVGIILIILGLALLTGLLRSPL